MIKPINDYIVVKLDEKQETTKSGIILSIEKDDKQLKDIGTIISVADGVTDLEPGQRIIFKRWSSEVAKIDEEEVVFVDVSSVIAILE